MNFFGAIKLMREGKKVIRLTVHKYPVYFREISGTKEKVLTMESKNFVVSLSDIMANDWEIFY